jgi:crotonobetainyl-CoA:carnitine CoA-transferase CaiB-like acyl-CoA transferase
MAHRFPNNPQLTPEIEEWLKKNHQIEDAALVLQEMRIMAAPVMSVPDVIEKDPQMEVRERLKEIDHPDLGQVKVLNTPIRTRGNKSCVEGLPPRVPGEHTDDVLSTILNKRQEEIDHLRASKIVFTGEKVINPAKDTTSNTTQG